MAISDKMAAKLNEQVTNEFYASHLYLAIACLLDGRALKMLSGWFRAQAEEERGHAMKIIGYLSSQGADVKLKGIPEPKADFDEVVDAVAAAHEHEMKVTKQFNELMALAESEKDYASREFIAWFINEQVEEEESTAHLRDIAKLAGKNLLQLESYAAQLNRRS